MAPTLANSLVVGITLIGAVALPTYVRGALGPEWLAALPPLVALLVTNTVVLAVLLGVGLNLVLNLLPGGDQGDRPGGRREGASPSPALRSNAD